MDSRAALGAAAAVALTVTGGVSALFLTVGQAASETPAPPPAAVIVEYVDQFGNPVPAPGTVPQAPTTPEIVLVNPDGTPVATELAAPKGYGEQQNAQYEEHEEHEDEEHEEHEDEEHEEDQYEEHEDNEDDRLCHIEHHCRSGKAGQDHPDPQEADRGR